MTIYWNTVEIFLLYKFSSESGNSQGRRVGSDTYLLFINVHLSDVSVQAAFPSGVSKSPFVLGSCACNMVLRTGSCWQT